MSTRSARGLGRGLGELFQNTTVDDSSATKGSGLPTTSSILETPRSDVMPDGSYFAELPVSAITPNPQQPRQVFDEENLDELAQSIAEFGLLQPVVVREKTSGDYELVMGERRWRAHQRAGISTIPAIVRSTDDTTMLRDALLENLHRANLNPLEEAAAYQQLLSDFGCTQDELATRIKRSRPQISNTIRLLKLPLSVQRRVAAGVLSAGHAKAILMLDNIADQEILAARVVAEGLSVRATEEAALIHESAKPRPNRTSNKKQPEDPHLTSAASSLSERLDTSVHVTLGTKHGRLVIDFADRDDFDRIIALLVAS